MLFSDKIKQLRIQNQMPQRQLAAALDIDTATYCKIERGERKAKREQILILAQMFRVDENELLTLWIADQLVAVVSTERNLASQALSLVVDSLEKSV